MDDIRRPQRPDRRDYALPGRPAAPHHSPHRPVPDHYQPLPARPQPTPAYHQAPAPQPHHNPVAYPPPQHQPIVHHQPQTHHKTSRRFSKKLSVVVAVIIAAAAVFGAGYMLKGSSPQTGIPSSITRQVNYSLYFPSPMPPGYIYMKDTATFQIGQVFYKFADGNKRVTVKEEPMPQTKPNLSLLIGYTQFSTPNGRAAIGSSFGQAVAVVVTPSTVITMNSVGGVSQNELRDAVNNLKNIGLNTNRKS